MRPAMRQSTLAHLFSSQNSLGGEAAARALLPPVQTPRGAGGSSPAP
eukprot:CAMPEP_0179955546 /NCGR_PEP_ID=MMETSP0983-20121128/26246_1 /TAXON_ID=483367 /ORGANISM="non described non described, Strain CCMP 2436" /LENGTH=46 /DNA_ID= /DNA_START= /DNA_END= /DNA_ORIENTATION=